MAPNYKQIAAQSAIKYGLDPELFKRQIAAESGFNPDAGSPAGAIGIAQIMPATAAGWGVNPRDPVASLDAAARAMSKYVKNYGGWENALVAYNAGPSRVGKPLYDETRNYIGRVLGGTSPSNQAGSALGGLSVASQGIVDPKKQKLLAQATVLGMQGGAGEDLFSRINSLSVEPGQVTQLNPIQYDSIPSHPGKTGGYRYLQKMGQKLFGLQNDPGVGQTTGGGHSVGSEHYSGRAIDFGTARNSPEQLAAWLRWARSKGYDAIDEGDHIHVSMPGGKI